MGESNWHPRKDKALVWWNIVILILLVCVAATLIQLAAVSYEFFVK